MPKRFAWPTMNEHLNNPPLPAVLDCICGNADLECEPVNEKLMDTRWQVRCYCGVRGAYGDGIKEAIDKWNGLIESPTFPPAPSPAANAAEVALIEGPMTPRQFAEQWYEGAPESESEETEQRITGLAAAISAHFTPRVPMADEGQTRLYTESEVQGLLEQERERAIKAYSEVINASPNGPTVERVRQKLERPEVSNG